jgi:ABC-type enterochelin transport system permease subunit
MDLNKEFGKALSSLIFIKIIFISVLGGVFQVWFADKTTPMEALLLLGVVIGLMFATLISNFMKATKLADEGKERPAPLDKTKVDSID